MKLAATLLLLCLSAVPALAQDGPPPPEGPPHAGPPGGPGGPGGHGGPGGPAPGGPPGDGPPPPDGEPEGPPGFLSPYEWDPSIPRGLVLHEAGAFDGYTLVAPINGTSAYAVDLDGSVVHEWSFDSAPGEWMYLLDDGNLLRSGREDDGPAFRGGGIGGRVQLVAPDSSVLWHLDWADAERCQHHDIEPLPNGHVLLISWERKGRREAVFHGRDEHHVGDAGLWPDAVYELRPTPPSGAEIVWEWHAWDHLVQDVDDKRPGFGWIAEHPGRIDVNFDHRDKPPATAAEIAEAREIAEAMAQLGYVGGAEEDGPDEQARSRLDRSGDWMHTNGIDYHPAYDLIVLSSPELNEVFILDHSTTTEEAAGSTGGRWGRGGELLWRWGNPRNHGAGTDDDRVLGYQHDPTFLFDGDADALRLLVFNNRPPVEEGAERESEILELVLPFDPERGFQHDPGAAFGPAEPAWRYADPGRFYSAFISGCQRLPNGNTLICSGAGGRIFEVTRDGRVVWDYRNPLGGDVTPPDHAGHAPPLSLFRATRVARDHPGMAAVLGD